MHLASLPPSVPGPWSPNGQTWVSGESWGEGADLRNPGPARRFMEAPLIVLGLRGEPLPEAPCARGARCRPPDMGCLRGHQAPHRPQGRPRRPSHPKALFVACCLRGDRAGDVRQLVPEGLWAGPVEPDLRAADAPGRGRGSP